MVNGFDNHLDNIYVLPLVETANIISLCDFAFMENQVNGTSMVFNIQPIANILTLAINRQRFTVKDIVDKERNELFRKLVRTVIIGTVRYNCRHSICIMKRTNKMITACLGCRIRRMRIIFCRFVEEVITVCKMMFF